MANTSSGKDTRNRDSSNFWMRMQSGTATLEDDLAVAYRAKTQVYPYHPVIVVLFTQLSRRLTYTKNLHDSIYSSFIHNCQKLEASNTLQQAHGCTEE